MRIRFVRRANGVLWAAVTDPQGREREVTLERPSATEPYDMFIDGVGVTVFEEATTQEEAIAAAKRALKREFEVTKDDLVDALAEA